MGNLYRSKEWRQTLDQVMQDTGISLEQIAEYIDSPYNGRETIFYARIPQKRKRYIGIGMALRQPLEVINDWILTYSGKRRLYAKDISEDLIWIYLIGLNCASDSDTNYFRMYEECQNAAYITYRQLWDEVTLGSIDTSDLEIRIRQMEYDDKFEGLKKFIMENLDSFKTAYSRPRRMLDTYVQCLLAGLNAGTPEQSGDEENSRFPLEKTKDNLKLNSLRGYLDDSMINFLSGSTETVHVIDKTNGFRTTGTKHIPVNRKTHISMCLALGMTTGEIDDYLSLMGFAPVGADEKNEPQLARELAAWEQTHPLQRKFKAEFIGNDGCCDMPPREMRKAAVSMLLMRQDLREAYAKKGMTFPYYITKERRK